MKRLLCVILLSIFVMACSSQPKRTTSLPQIVEPVKYTYSVKAVYPHDTNSYTQGLQFIDGVLWEGTGEWGKSVLQKVDLHSGKAEVLASLPKSEFGEGITVLGDKVYQLTWTNNKVHVYDLQGNHLKDMRYVGEGWGLTSDGESLYMSNGTTDIYKVNPETFKREGKITVTLRGEAVNFINELEWIDGKIWANVYTTDYVVIINPQTGIVEGMIDFTGLLKEEDMTERTDVLNGIAYDAEGKRIFVTGKLWNKLFEVEINK
ncbi:MAG: glutaminyl-peptide cyclotransferase [Alistipes sp.]|nr:glutaminyl-peptide cyclotransferase [Alistipes sp.]